MTKLCLVEAKWDKRKNLNKKVHCSVCLVESVRREKAKGNGERKKNDVLIKKYFPSTLW